MNARVVIARPRAGTAPAQTVGVAGRPFVLALCGLLLCSAPAPAEAPPETPDSRAVEIWTVGGWAALEGGDDRGAGQAFLAARQLAPTLAEPLVGLGVSALRAGRDEEAVGWLRQALKRDPQADRADRLLGQIHERRGNVRTALGYFEAAVRKDPGDVTAREGLLRVRGEVEFDATLDELFGRHFIVKYPAGERALAMLTAERLERVYKTLGRLFAYSPSDPVTVILYPPDRFHAVTASPRWTEGLYDGRLHLPLPSRSRPLEEYDGSLAHEYAHAVISGMSAGRAPAWLQEGLAQYSEEAVRSGKPRPAPALGSDNAVLLQAHAGSFQGAAPAEAAAAYAESYAVVKQLLQRQGMKKMRLLLTALAKDQDFDRAFLAAFGRPWTGGTGPGPESGRHLLPPAGAGERKGS